MRALAPGGVLSVTLWNKEEPPKSVLKLYATMAAAAREVDPRIWPIPFFVASSYLSTATVLYKNGGFTPDGDRDKLRAHTRAMSFDEIYSPGLLLRFVANRQHARRLRRADFCRRRRRLRPLRRTSRELQLEQPASDDADTADPGKGDDAPPSGKADDGVLPATVMGRLAWHALIAGQWPRWRLDTCSIRARSPTIPPISPPTSRLMTCPACSTDSSCCRTSGGIS